MNLTPDEQATIDRALIDFDPGKALANVRARDLMPAEDWDYLIGWERKDLETGLRRALAVRVMADTFERFGLRRLSLEEMKQMEYDLSEGAGNRMSMEDVARHEGIYKRFETAAQNEMSDAAHWNYERAIEQTLGRGHRDSVLRGGE